MMQPPLRANVAANTQAAIMQRLLLSAQAGLSSSSSSSSNATSTARNSNDRSRDEFALPSRATSLSGRSFQSQAVQQANDFLELMANGEALNLGLNGYGIGSTMFPNMANPPQLSVVYLRCPECGIGKTSSEEMEVHIKMEHLQWLPFQCPICSAERASDLQMREHIHSSHRKNSNKFIYVDNPSAKRLLQILMDRSLSSARRPSSTQNGLAQLIGSSNYGSSDSSSANGSTGTTNRERPHTNGSEENRSQQQEGGGISGTSTPPTEPRGDSPLRNLAALSNGRERHTPPVNQQQQSAPSATATIVPRKRPASHGLEAALTGHSSTDALLAAIRATTNEATGEPSPDGGSPLGEGYDDDTEDGGIAETMAQIFAASKKRLRAELDASDNNVMHTDDSLMTATNDEAHDPADILGNVAAMFNAEDIDVNGLRRRSVNGVYSSSRSKANSSSVSKKRVLGECSKCKKPVTAGARQMHMFYHLGKDCNIYRFRCKYPNCDVEHYRKDQMENHHSKQHGKIDPALMEDRTAELFNSCQELSMQLLGTTGNTPGPTAAKAQLAYNASLAAQAQNQLRKRKKHISIDVPHQFLTAPVINSPTTESGKPLSTTSLLDAALKLSTSDHAEEQTLECRLCHKHMYNRIRGFHILWHMAKDLGINRYACRYCTFGHDRSQSVQTHGKREHGIEDCVEDRIEEYSDEVKSMSEACFGFQALFSQDGRRRTKNPLSASKSDALDDATEGSEGGLSIDHNDEDDEIEAHNKVVASASPDSHMDEADESNANENVAENSKAATLLQEVSSSQEDCKSEVLSSVMRMSSTPANDAQTTTVSTTVSPVARNTPSASVKAVTTVSPKCETRPSLTSTSALSASSSSTSSSTNHQRSRKSKNRRFGIRKPPSRLKRKEVAKLREMSMRLGGAQYFKKRVNETAQCEKCGVITTSRMSDHAYRHMDAQLFLCPHCDNGSQSRELVVRHMRDMHSSTEHPIDDRLKYAAEIKEMIRQCYPAFFIDAPIPTAADIEKLKASLAMNGSCKEEVDGGQEDDGNEAEADEAEHDTEESGDEGDDSGLHDDDETGHDEEDGMKDDQMDDDQNGTVEAEELDVKNTTPSSKTASRREDEEEIEAEM